MAQVQAVVINPGDSVAVALQALPAGCEIVLAGQRLKVLDDVPRGHKVALTALSEGAPVIKYGYPIGHARQAIARGAHVHTHNVATNLSGTKSYVYEPAGPAVLAAGTGEFAGYERADGQVGIRNELWIIPTVFCVNHLCEELRAYAQTRLADFPGVEACLALTHPYGCSQMGEDQATTQRVLAALTRHPNAGAVLVVGLGCENNNLQVFRPLLEADDPRLAFLNAQDEEDELSAGKALVDRLLAQAGTATRTSQPLSRLRIGLKCGGSDGLSGITANPLIGRVSDLVVSAGGTAVMTEVPEMFGAEQILMNRARNEGVFTQIVALINDFKEYFRSHGETIAENPSPGNKAGGITTLEDKSLGCVQKGGRSPVSGVLRYGQRLSSESTGLQLLQGPGSDGVSCSALATAGVHLILFSTGRGTPFGTVVPTLKIATNSDLFARKGGSWIDFNAGRAAEGESLDTLSGELLELVLRTASGTKAAAEKRGVRELLIWKDGVTL